MSAHVFTITVDVDDEALTDWIAESETKGGPYTTKFDEWIMSDLVRAMDYEIIECDDCELSYLGPAPDQPGDST